MYYKGLPPRNHAMAKKCNKSSQPLSTNAAMTDYNKVMLLFIKGCYTMNIFLYLTFFKPSILKGLLTSDALVELPYTHIALPAAVDVLGRWVIALFAFLLLKKQKLVRKIRLWLLLV